MLWQTYCADCITERLTANNTCPKDRKIITIDWLVTNRIVHNMVSKWKIGCEFQGKGCESIVILDSLAHI